jgi:hypothetical protein
MIVHGLEDEWVNADSAPILHQAAGPNAELWLIENMR